MRFCPGFLVDAASSLSAKAFLENHFTLEQCCTRTFEHLSQNYDDNFTDLAVNIADFKLRVLVEAGIEDAACLFKSHIYGLLHYKSDLGARPWNSIFRDPLKPQKTATTEKELVNKGFVAFVFNYKNGKLEMAPSSWTISSSETSAFINEMGKIWER
jgi:predicted Zn-dependent protease with MMP-like domain